MKRYWKARCLLLLTTLLCSFADVSGHLNTSLKLLPTPPLADFSAVHHMLPPDVPILCGQGTNVGWCLIALLAVSAQALQKCVPVPSSKLRKSKVVVLTQVEVGDNAIMDNAVCKALEDARSTLSLSPLCSHSTESALGYVKGKTNMITNRLLEIFCIQHMKVYRKLKDYQFQPIYIKELTPKALAVDKWLWHLQTASMRGLNLLLLACGDVESNPGPLTGFWMNFSCQQLIDWLEKQNIIFQAAHLENLKDKNITGYTFLRLSATELFDLQFPLAQCLDLRNIIDTVKQDATETSGVPTESKSNDTTSSNGVYIERECAACDDVLQCMESSGFFDRSIVFFLGPSGSGKTATLQQVYERAIFKGMKAKLINVRMTKVNKYTDYSRRDTYIFVDEAQCLPQRLDLLDYINECGKGICLAFSPVLLTSRGYIDLNFPLKSTARFYFTPFSDEELLLYAFEVRKHCGDGKLHILEEARNEGVTLPGVITHALGEDSSVLNILYTFAWHTVLKLSDESSEFHDEIIKALIIGNIEKHNQTLSLCTGLFYREKHNHSVKPVFPGYVILPYLQQQINTIFSTMRTFDLGKAMEYLFCASAQQGIEFTCKGKEAKSITGRTPQSQSFNLRCNNVLVQQHEGELIRRTGCTLIKLCERPVAIDFLIRDSRGAKSAHKLFLVQVSAQKYQEQASEKKLSAVTEKIGKNCVNLYADLACIEPNRCYFVYATTEVPMSDTFSRLDTEKERVYFAQLQMP